MKKNEIMNRIVRAASKATFTAKKYSPEVLVVVGVVGVVASAVMACKATTKVNDILEEHNDTMEKIHTASEKCDEETYSEEDAQKDTTITCVQTAVKFTKLYGPSVALGVASLACILTSHRILCKRNAAMGAAYAGVAKAFKDYRGRVIERFGDDVDKELRYNIKAQEVETVVKHEDGTETVEKKTVKVAEFDGVSEYARFFDECSRNWDKDAEMNLMFLKRQQDYANELFKSRGYLFLNDVYGLLGIQKTKAGQIVGWWYDEKNPTGDNFIDFGIYNMDCVQSVATKRRDFVNGYERSILLDFNVDGDILYHFD